MSDITNGAFQTTWGTIRIINLHASNKGQRDAAALFGGGSAGIGEAFRSSFSGRAQSAVDFKAFLKSFRDSFNPGWSEQQYPNQSVPIAHQVSPKRTLSFSFSVPAYSEREGILNMRKCSFLAESMYPAMVHKQQSQAYDLKSSFMAIKFANLIQNSDGGPLPGFISGFVFVPNLEEGVFINDKKGFSKQKSAPGNVFVHESQSYIIPKLIDIDINFTPIEVRDGFGYQTTKYTEGWANDGAWPYGIKTDPGSGGMTSGAGTGDLAPNEEVTKIINRAASGLLK